ncbi:phage tail protein [Paenibacillus macerans]|uniref:phage tail protein n=1 Tax=Paenibacillus macerans TaxID=44252 RepID=UPI00203E6465|nr:tail fiber protein [Paenibacillus macerans]MCM3698760.1 tail fiber protein [Paenibacillus macerans]
MMKSFYKKVLILGALGVMLTAGTAVNPGQAEASTDPYLGEIQLFPYSFTPEGWMKAEGQELSISQNTALYSLLGTKFGGNGQTTFALPDLRGASPMPGISYYISINGPFPPRE